MAGRSDAVGAKPFPTTEDAVDRVPGRGYDAVVAKLSPDGRSLKYATLLGAKGNDTAYGVAVGSDGSIYVCGFSTSKKPTTRRFGVADKTSALVARIQIR